MNQITISINVYAYRRHPSINPIKGSFYFAESYDRQTDRLFHNGQKIHCTRNIHIHMTGHMDLHCLRC